MLNLIRADFYKTIHGKVLKVCFLMMTGWIFLCAYAQKATIGMREYLVQKFLQITGILFLIITRLYSL